MSQLGLSICMGLLYWVARLRLGYTISAMFLQPIVLSPIIGLLYGDLNKALIIGAGIQLIYLGVTSTPGGNVPADPALATCIAVPIALTINLDPQMAIALAVPFGMIGGLIDQIRRTVNATWVHMADKYAKDSNTKGIYLCAFIYPAIFGLILRFPPVFAATYLGHGVVETFLKALPIWLTHSFQIMGGILPALGFAITILVINKKSLLPFFIIGFFIVQYGKISTMGAAIFGICIAFLFTQFVVSKRGGVNE